MWALGPLACFAELSNAHDIRIWECLVERVPSLGFWMCVTIGFPIVGSPKAQVQKLGAWAVNLEINPVKVALDGLRFASKCCRARTRLPFKSTVISTLDPQHDLGSRPTQKTNARMFEPEQFVVVVAILYTLFLHVVLMLIPNTCNESQTHLKETWWSLCCSLCVGLKPVLLKRQRRLSSS